MKFTEIADKIQKKEYKEVATFLQGILSNPQADVTKTAQAQEWHDRLNQAIANDGLIKKGKALFEVGDYLHALDQFSAVKKARNTLEFQMEEASALIHTTETAMKVEKTEVVAVPVPTEEQQQEETKVPPIPVIPADELTGTRGPAQMINLTEIYDFYPWDDKDAWISSPHDWGLEALAQSLDRHGMQDPIHVVISDPNRTSREAGEKTDPKGPKAYIICGSNRFRAAQLTSRYKDRIPVVMAVGLKSYQDVKEYALENNWIRKGLKPDEEKASNEANLDACLAMGEMAILKGYDPDIELRGGDQTQQQQSGMTIKDLEKMLKAKKTHIAENIRLNKLHAEDTLRVRELGRKMKITKLKQELGIRPKPKEIELPDGTTGHESKTSKFETTLACDKWNEADIIQWCNEVRAKWGQPFSHFKLSLDFQVKT